MPERTTALTYDQLAAVLRQAHELGTAGTHGAFTWWLADFMPQHFPFVQETPMTKPVPDEFPRTLYTFTKGEVVSFPAEAAGGLTTYIGAAETPLGALQLAHDRVLDELAQLIAQRTTLESLLVAEKTKDWPTYVVELSYFITTSGAKVIETRPFKAASPIQAMDAARDCHGIKTLQDGSTVSQDDTGAYAITTPVVRVTGLENWLESTQVAAA